MPRARPYYLRDVKHLIAGSYAAFPRTGCFSKPVSQASDTLCPPGVPKAVRKRRIWPKMATSESGISLALIAAVASVGTWDVTGRDLVIGHWSRLRATICLLSAAVPLLPSQIWAQGSGRGFLFKQPTLQVGIHGGYTRARAGGSVLDFARNELTLKKRDFDASAWGLELAVRASERLDIAFDVRVARSEVGSEMRDWVDQDNLPIEQTTTFVRVPVTVSTKYYLRDRGRALSEFVWIPEKWAPFVGAGGGLAWYRFRGSVARRVTAVTVARQ